MARSLSVEGLTAELGGRAVLKDINFTLDGPQWFGLLGANGSGKTTLLRALSGRLAPSQGRILVDGADLAAAPERRARVMGYAPALNTLPSGVMGGELLALAAAARKADPRRPVPLRDALRIDALRDHRVEAMSSGMRQRLALFLAFLGEPGLVLLDEPFNWLDPVAAYDAKACLAELARTTLILAALHDVATFALRCASGFLLHDGEVTERFDGTDLAAARADLGGFELSVYDRLARAGRLAAPARTL